MPADQHLVQFTIPASDTTPIVLTGFGHTPEVLITSWNGAITPPDQIGRADSHRGTGFAIGSGAADQQCVVHLMPDGLAASNTFSGAFQSLVSLVKATGAGSAPFSDGTARLASINEDGITLDITTPFSIAITVTLISLGPELVTDKAIQLNTFPAVTGDQVITGLGFQPSGIVFVSIGRDPSEPSFSQFVLGFAADDGASGVDQSLLVGYSRGNGQSADTRRYCRRDYCLGLSSESPGLNELERRASLTSFDTDGFTLDHDTVFASTKVFGFLALDGPGFRAGNFTAGQEAVTGLPFVPRGGLFISAGSLESPDTLDMPADDISIYGQAAINDVTGLDQAGGSTRSEDGNPFAQISIRRTTIGVLGGIKEDSSADGLTRIGPMRNDGFDIQTIVPWENGDVFAGYFTFGAPQPSITDSRLAIVPAGSQDPPVATFTKDPSSVLDYGMNWAAPLSTGAGALVDSIKKSTWSAPTGIVIDESPPSSFNGNETRVWLSGGTNKKKYDVVNRIETQEGRVYERTIQIQVQER